MSNVILFQWNRDSYSIAKGYKKIGDTITPLLKAKIIRLQNIILWDLSFQFTMFTFQIALSAINDISRERVSKYLQLLLMVDLGICLQDIREALSGKEVILQEYKIRTPGNYILEYGALPKTYQEYILKKAEKQINKISGFILEVKKTGYIKPNLIARIFHSRSDKQRSLFSELGSDFYAKEHCVHCYQCVKLCPTKNITISNGI